MAVRILRATTTFLVGPEVISEGTVLLSTNPVVKGRESLFEDVAEVLGVEVAVEQATAAPGEKRTRATKKVD